MFLVVVQMENVYQIRTKLLLFFYTVATNLLHRVSYDSTDEGNIAWEKQDKRYFFKIQQS